MALDSYRKQIQMKFTLTCSPKPENLVTGDAFYACLEKESNKRPTEIASVGLLYPVECKTARAQFEKQCRASWVKHFNRQYCRNKGVQRLLVDDNERRGPLILPQPYTFKPIN